MRGGGGGQKPTDTQAIPHTDTQKEPDRHTDTQREPDRHTDTQKEPDRHRDRKKPYITVWKRRPTC